MLLMMMMLDPVVLVLLLLFDDDGGADPAGRAGVGSGVVVDDGGVDVLDGRWGVEALESGD